MLAAAVGVVYRRPALLWVWLYSEFWRRLQMSQLNSTYVPAKSWSNVANFPILRMG